MAGRGEYRGGLDSHSQEWVVDAQGAPWTVSYREGHRNVLVQDMDGLMQHFVQAGLEGDLQGALEDFMFSEEARAMPDGLLAEVIEAGGLHHVPGWVPPALAAIGWRAEVEAALASAVEAFGHAGEPITREMLEVEYLPAPHAPGRLRPGESAVYGFWWRGEWLKIGRVGPHSGARYLSQHYHRSTRSSLANSLAGDLAMRGLPGLDPADPGLWIRAATCRVNIMLPPTLSPLYTAFLEAFLHLRLHPRYERPW